MAAGRSQNLATRGTEEERKIGEPRFGTRGGGLGAVCAVELRKIVDTVSGVVLIAVGAVLAGVFGGGAVLLRPGASLSEIAQLAGVPGGILAAVMAILLVTVERSHHTGVVTYTMTPRRGRVVFAKAVAAIGLGVVVVALALVAAVVINPVGAVVTGEPANWAVDTAQLGWWALGTVVMALSGFALGLALGNAPAAITLVLVWPMASSLLGRVPGLADVVPWLDVAALATFTDGATGLEIGRALTGLAVWVVVPTIAGTVRVLRAEVR